MLASHLIPAVHPRLTGIAIFLMLSTFIAGCSGGTNEAPPSASTGNPTAADQAVGERLFLETRFAQTFNVFVSNGGDVNNPTAGDAVMDSVETTGLPITPGPFAGTAMNCRACHMVDDVLTAPGGGMRTYADFARRSPIPSRADGKTHAPRNSPALVNSTLDRPDGVLFHFDAEFNSMEDLVAATFTGRNFGWLPGEKSQAIAHIANVVRHDDGRGDLASQFDGLPYRLLLTGTNPGISDDFVLSPRFRIFVGSSTDREIFDAVVRIVAAYVNGLLFSQTEDSGALIRSPFDVFLEINRLPQQPSANETPIDYSRRLRTLINAPGFTPRFVTTNPNRQDGRFQFHTQSFTFGATELEGLKIFLEEPATIPASATELTAGRIGNCLSCHAAPNFTDFKLHNTGTAQKEYDDIHGPGQFAHLAIPNLATRNGNYDQFLPATEHHPAALEPFRSIPVLAHPELTDLGIWNVFANPDHPGPQAKIRTLLCDHQVPCLLTDTALLDRAIARFKTPGLRDLSHSAPYMHNGQFDTLEDVMAFYRAASAQARAATLRNGASQLQGIALTAGDVTPLVAFLKSLNEDYQ